MSTFWTIFLPIILGILGITVGLYLHRKRTQELSDELDTLQVLNAQLTHAQDALHIRCESLNSAYNALNETHKRLDFNHNNLLIEFAEFRADKPSFLPVEADNSALESQITGLESQLAAVNTEYAAYKNTTESRLSEAAGQLIILRSQYDSMLDNYIEQGQRLKRLSHQPVAFSGNYAAEKRADEARISQLEVELATALAAQTALQSDELARNQQLDEQYGAMLDKYVQQGQLLKNMETEVSEWQSHYESLMLKKNDQDAHVLEYEDLRESLEKEVKALKGQIEEQQNVNNALENDLAKLKEAYTNLDEEKTKIKTSFASMTTSLSASSSNWELRYNELETRYSSLSRRFHDATANNERMENTIAGLNNELLTHRRRANPDDLKLIEGVGPKIEELLNNEGIYKFEQLATANTETIRAILDKAGPRFRMHDPHSWANQAELAQKGEWVKLKEYQDYLVGGRSKEQPFVAVASR
jgi:predicted flap endonuclease-1-like 5' DNA nuclease